MAHQVKRHRRGRLLIDLPEDVLDIIFAHLERSDVKQLSLASREFRSRLVSYIFKHAQASWDQIIRLQKNPETSPISKYTGFVRSISIIDANSFNEYQQRTFEILLSSEVLPLLTSVIVNSGNLSYWLKYNECQHIRSLTLYSDVKQINSIKIFHLSHVSGLHGLTLLSLSKYHFNWVEEEEALNSAVSLENLSLHDCTWEYPFDLNCFNRNNSLRDLAITYSNDNPFILLERFVGFLEHPFPDHSGSLRNISIQYFGFTSNKKVLTPKILAKFLHSFDGLEVLLLEGWTANLSYLRQLIKSHTFAFPTSISLAVESLGEVSAQDFKLSLNDVTNLRLVVNNV